MQMTQILPGLRENLVQRELVFAVQRECSTNMIALELFVKMIMADDELERRTALVQT